MRGKLTGTQSLYGDVLNLVRLKLKAQYLARGTVGMGAWAHISVGIRMGLDIGAHRKKAYSSPPSVEEELLKRAFWCVYVRTTCGDGALTPPRRSLILLEWGTSYSLGRPFTIHDEEYVFIVFHSFEFDHTFLSLDLPPVTDCDDEYWLDTEGKPLFQQPPGIPSKVAFFGAAIRLLRMLAYATRTLVG